MAISRRSMLNTAALGTAALGLAACGVLSTSTINGVTTVTVNVAQIGAWGSAFINASALVYQLPGIAGTPIGTTLLTIGSALGSDLDAFTKASGNSISLTFNGTSVPSAVRSLFTDGQTLLTVAKGALGSVAAAALRSAQTYVTAVETIVALFTVVMGIVPVTASAVLGAPMTEAQALAVLQLK
jgi:hypothetical protein